MVQVSQLDAMPRVLDCYVEVDWCGTLLTSYETLLGKTWLNKLLVSHIDELETEWVYDRLYGRTWITCMLGPSVSIKNHSECGPIDRMTYWPDPYLSS